MAKVGEILTSPEDGWTRHNDTNENLYRTGGWVEVGGISGHYSADFCRASTIGDSIKFNFTGPRMRIMGVMGSSYDSEINVRIDDVLYCFSNKSYSENNNSQSLLYEKIGLSNSEHYVEMILTTGGGNGFIFDAIDIDVTGVLKPYKIINNNKFLIKQGSQFFNIANKYIPLILTGGSQPNDSDYTNFGFTDIAPLLNITTQITQKGVDKGVLGVGKCFEFDLNDDLNNIASIE